MTTWRDVTNYRMDEGLRVARTWELNTGVVRMLVLRVGTLDGWYLLCPQLGMTDRFLGDDLATAQTSAIAEVREELRRMMESLP